MQRFGEYVLLDRLGQGAGGTVHLARQVNASTTDPRMLVVKRLHEELLDKPTFVRRFQHEALIAVSVDSPHVVRVVDVGRVGDTPYIAMEYVEGKRLIDVLRRIAALDDFVALDVIVAIIVGALDGLGALHDAVHPETHEPLSAVHRDVSPSNLILSYEGHLKLIDLGLGKSNVQDWQTRTGAVLGSLGYMAPEQVVGGRVDHRADLYALTAVFYELLALEPYVARADRHEMLRAMEAPDVRPPSLRRSDVPPALDKLVAEGLAHDADDRIQSAEDMRARLVRIIPPAPRHRVATFLIDLVGPEQIADTSRVRDLLAQPIAVDDPSLSNHPTIVFARRTSTIQTLDDLDPINDDDDDADGAATALLGAKNRLKPTVTPRTPTHTPTPERLDHRTTTPNAPVVEIRTTHRGGIPVGVVVILLAVAVGLTVVIDRLVIGRATALAPTTPPPPVVVEERAKSSTPIPRLVAPTPPKGAPTPERDEVRTRPTRRRPARRVEAPAPPPSKAAVVNAEVRRLTARSESLRRARPARSNDLDAILADISVWSASKNYDKALQALRVLERSLDRIAAQ